MIQELVTKWRTNSNERKQLQMVYVALFLATLVLAGLFSLVNSAVGSTLLTVALGALSLYVANIIIWALVSMALMTLDERQRKTVAAARRRK